MRCDEARSQFSALLDSQLNGSEMSAMSSHLRKCTVCAAEYGALDRTQELIVSLGRHAAPPDLAMKIRVSLSQARNNSFERRLQAYAVRLENALNSFMLPATAGLVTAILVFGLFVGFFVQTPVPVGNDVPTSLYMPPRLTSSPFTDGISDGPIVIEAIVDATGRLQDYRIIAGDDNAEIRKHLDRSLLFTVFEPAKSFGAPTTGRIVISFANVSVKG
jgi:hypothetical protein